LAGFSRLDVNRYDELWLMGQHLWVIMQSTKFKSFSRSPFDLFTYRAIRIFNAYRSPFQKIAKWWDRGYLVKSKSKHKIPD
jgi:hypothetical protein